MNLHQRAEKVALEINASRTIDAKDAVWGLINGKVVAWSLRDANAPFPANVL